MGRIPKKSSRVVAQAKEKGRKQAEIDAEYSRIPKWFKKIFSGRNKKYRVVKYWSYVEGLISRLTADPFKTVAIIGVAFTIKTGIEWTEEIVVNVMDKTSPMRNFFISILGLYMPLVPVLGQLIPQTTPQTRQEVKDAADAPVSEVLQWVLSFTVAYLIVHNFGSLIESGASVLGIAKILIGLV